jgi:amidase
MLTEDSRPHVSTRDVLQRSALDQAQLVKSGAISCEELTWMYLDVIDRKNPLISAFVDVLHEQAIREARAFDRKRRGERPLFWGVPIGIKDLNLARGSFTRFGSRAFERLFTPFDDATTAQLRRGGFVIIGKTATSELGSLPVTEPDIHPPTRNPWDLGVTPGGSSGGAGAAVAAGMIPIAQGSDAAGSIRIPASFCHLVGLKPSRGRVENSYSHEDSDILYSCGPITRTVDDAAAMLDIMAGITVGKPHWAPPPSRPFLELAQRPPRSLRIRFTTSIAMVDTLPDVAAAVERVARTLASLGHRVEPGTALAGSIEEFLPVWQHTAAQAPVHDWALTQRVTRWLGEHGRGLRREDVARVMAKMSRQVLEWFGDVDLWVTPTVAVAPPKIGAWRDLAPPDAFAEAVKLGVFTAPFNVSGQPAISLPAGMTRTGHPIGVQIVGRQNADATVLAVARQIEDALPWAGVEAPAIVD